jgi:hypothetical protein
VKVIESNKMCLLIDVNEKLMSQKVNVQLREINGTKPEMGNVNFDYNNMSCNSKFNSINLHIDDIVFLHWRMQTSPWLNQVANQQ